MVSANFLEKITVLEHLLMFILATIFLFVLVAIIAFGKASFLLTSSLMGLVGFFALWPLASFQLKRRGFILKIQDHETTVKYRLQLINAAIRSIHFVAGCLSDRFWGQEEVFEALKEAGKRGVNIYGLWGTKYPIEKPQEKPTLLKRLEEESIPRLNLDRLSIYPARHFLLIDNLDARWEHNHPDHPANSPQQVVNTFIHHDLFVVLVCRLLFRYYKTFRTAQQ